WHPPLRGGALLDAAEKATRIAKALRNRLIFGRLPVFAEPNAVGGLLGVGGARGRLDLEFLDGLFAERDLDLAQLVAAEDGEAHLVADAARVEPILARRGVDAEAVEREQLIVGVEARRDRRTAVERRGHEERVAVFARGDAEVRRLLVALLVVAIERELQAHGAEDALGVDLLAPAHVAIEERAQLDAGRLLAQRLHAVVGEALARLAEARPQKAHHVVERALAAGARA